MIGRYDQAKERQAYITDQLTNNKQQQYRNAKACHSEKKDERKKKRQMQIDLPRFTSWGIYLRRFFLS